MSLLVKGATVEGPDGQSQLDVRLDGGVIVEVGALAAGDQDDVVDGSGYLMLPAPAEPHAHLDKALTADDVPNPAGDLLGAIKAWVAHRSTLTVEDIEARATEAVKLGVSNGVTVFRTHVDLGTGIGLTGLEALQRVKENVAGFATVEIVGLIGCPLTGSEGANNRAIIIDALAHGLDIVGGVPHLDPDPSACTRWLLELAAEHDRPLDLHTDENLRTTSSDLEYLADLIIETGFANPATASHCVSLGMMDEGTQKRVAEKVATAGISVLALPQTNLFLQSRDTQVAPPRGLTAIKALRTAGVNVAGGADNLQDPFCTVGRGDPLETASLLVMAGHLTPEDAYEAVSNNARHAMSLPKVRMQPGDPGDLLLIKAKSIRHAVAVAPQERIVIRAGVTVFRAGELCTTQ